MPTIPIAMPADWSRLGRSPETSPTTTGSSALMPTIGATMLIRPNASAR